MAKELTWKKAISKVLEDSSTALHYKDIAERIISENLRQSLGATPAATVIAQITGSIKRDGEKSPYVRVAKGTYTLAKKNQATQGIPTKAREIEASEDRDTEEQYDVVSSFGMFWRRDQIEWIASAKLLGMQQLGATPVDFSKQLAVYLLYDGREVIYVGRTTERPLGRRLYEHTSDRFSARWDRFSWFGFLPVSDAGELEGLPEGFGASKVIPAIEAIMIEALEPRQNRKRGDDLAAVEYIQKEDPEVQKKRIKASLDTVISKL